MSIGFSPYTPYPAAQPGRLAPAAPIGQLNGNTQPINDLNAIRQRLNGRIINASRLLLMPNQLIGLKDGQPIMLPGYSGLPRTGQPWIDRRLQHFHDIGDYFPSAVGTSVSYTLRGGLLGGLIGGLGSGLLVGLMKGLGYLRYPQPPSEALEKASLLAAWRNLPIGRLIVATALAGVASSLLGMAGGFLHSVYQNLVDFKRTFLD